VRSRLAERAPGWASALQAGQTRSGLGKRTPYSGQWCSVVSGENWNHSLVRVRGVVSSVRVAQRSEAGKGS
jgi:hypothetical protein